MPEYRQCIYGEAVEASIEPLTTGKKHKWRALVNDLVNQTPGTNEGCEGVNCPNFANCSKIGVAAMAGITAEINLQAARER